MAIKLADTLAPMADFPAAMAEHIAFADGETLQGKVDNGGFGVPEDIRKEITDLKKSVSDGKTLVAGAITDKGVETAADATFAVMADNISAITTGVDTSDATATAIDIMAGKTAWVKGNKITGIATSSELHGATISVSSEDDVLVGKDITLSKDGTVVGSRTLDENLVCSFAGIQEVGEYIISASVGDLSNEKSVTITSDNVINKTVIAVAFSVGSLLSKWVRVGRVTQTFSTLDEVFADEVTVRQLMTVHDSVDFLKRWMLSEPEIIDTFVANATAMKWMGLRDYAYDTLTAGVVGLEDKILASENWEYALKDHNPVMTSNTAPYGNVIYKDVYGDNYYGDKYIGYKGFTESLDEYYMGQDNSSDSFLGYKFTNPICVKRLYFVSEYNGTSAATWTNAEVQGSNDNESWEIVYDIGDITVPNGGISARYEYDFNNDSYYTYYRLIVKSISCDRPRICIARLQFYGRSLNVSVPTMTSNTAPYGEVNGSGHLVTSHNYDLYHAFDKKLATVSNPTNAYIIDGLTGWVSYKFDKPVCVKKASIQNFSADLKDTWDINRSVKTFKIQASNDGVEWVDLTEELNHSNTYSYVSDVCLNNASSYLYYRVDVLSSFSSTENNNQTIIDEIQFYGVDYSEREFAEGSTMKYIYDHGVELEELTTVGYGSGLEPTYESNQIYFSPTNESKHRYAGLANAIDLTSYSILRATIGDKAVIANNSYVYMMLGESKANSIDTQTSIAYKNLSNIRNPENDLYIDISGVSGNKFINITSGYQTRSVTIKEWWLE